MHFFIKKICVYQIFFVILQRNLVNGKNMSNSNTQQRTESQAWQASRDTQGTIIINDPTWLH
jgi:hypothetical protein